MAFYEWLNPIRLNGLVKRVIRIKKPQILKNINIIFVLQYRTDRVNFNLTELSNNKRKKICVIFRKLVVYL